MRFPSKSRRLVALIPAAALDPNAAAIGFSVVVTSIGVCRFADQWPASNFHDAPIRFEFGANGDLVEIWNEPRFANPEALLCLSLDAQAFGEKVIERRRAVQWPQTQEATPWAS